MPEATTFRISIASSTRITACGSPKRCPSSSGTTSSVFLLHWCSRIAASQSFTPGRVRTNSASTGQPLARTREAVALLALTSTT